MIELLSIAAEIVVSAMIFGLFLWASFTIKKGTPTRLTQMALYSIPLLLAGRYFIEHEAAWFCMRSLIAMMIALYVYDYIEAK